jgi:hypothetical protein
MIVTEVDEPDRAYALLTSIGRTVSREGTRLLIAPDIRCGAAQINAILVEAGVSVSHLVTQGLTLEDAFLELTNSSAPLEENTVQ